MKSKLLLGAVGFASLLATSNAHSQTITTTFVTVNPSETVDGAFDGSSFAPHPSGVLQFDNIDFDAFCADPLQSISFGETLTYNVQNIADLNNSAAVASLVGGYLASSHTAAEASAFQWAIWEVLKETSPTLSLNSGNVIIGSGSSATATLANSYLAAIATYTPAALTYLTHPSRQDMVTWNGPANPVPEPATAALLGLSAFMLMRRRR